MLGSRPSMVVGIDEAGRGAWLGPLVVGAVAVPRGSIPTLIASGARDSKTLLPKRRDAILELIEGCAQTRTLAASPAEIDRHVAEGGLNRLEASMFGRLAREFSPAEARVDACDTNARRFGSAVARHAGAGVLVIARHRADATDPVVGAASIVAKVARDRAVQQLAESLGEEIGSGYPSDEATVRFVRRTVPPGGPRPPWLRASWATTRRIIGPVGPRAVPAEGQ